ncbi:YolD-like family protein [Paenibacillus apiarius]|uniref:YolD-like family protein n=1 Tax=Paenibacillus apiarius TaxID=46240 RepID=A0ABT4DSD8_9BACL|nr:YolD-like family protein [Paenibacillus apiarius]MCY9513338.1 YolD-like family protein [Paenibacillus apiarius]MCY9519690.1 YolD-like family protein [Paenibacillus apiarius]MCY9553254.1 YolD-like family protein [Paenibacillus apiarius]MCY9557104.1 YolD-like family protein [Paenibacillus apiarius]MCY9682155.1 YolD-like family protein [Paenibacillus apiarius]
MSKLDGNGIWEGSRFIMPEHREAWVKRQHGQNRRPRPTLDEQEWEQIGHLLQRSMEDREPVALVLFDPFERCEEIGVVADIDMLVRRVKLLQDDVSKWIKVDDIIKVVTI